MPKSAAICCNAWPGYSPDAGPVSETTRIAPPTGPVGATGLRTADVHKVKHGLNPTVARPRLGIGLAGERDACRQVPAVIMARVRLLGLIEQPKRPAGWRPRTVVSSAEDREAVGLCEPLVAVALRELGDHQRVAWE
jgi:hypothetical protein